MIHLINWKKTKKYILLGLYVYNNSYNTLIRFVLTVITNIKENITDENLIKYLNYYYNELSNFNSDIIEHDDFDYSNIRNLLSTKKLKELNIDIINYKDFDCSKYDKYMYIMNKDDNDITKYLIEELNKQSCVMSLDKNEIINSIIDYFKNLLNNLLSLINSNSIRNDSFELFDKIEFERNMNFCKSLKENVINFVENNSKFAV